MNNIFRHTRVFILLAALVSVALVFVGCGGDDNDTGTTVTQQGAQTEGSSGVGGGPINQVGADFVRPDNHITIEWFSPGWGQNHIGMSTGWFAQIVDEKFNLSINHIGAPDGMDEVLLQTRSAAGNLGDVVLYWGADFRDFAESGLLMDISDLVAHNMPHYNEHFASAVQFARQNLSIDGRLYGIPPNVSTQSPTEPAFNGMFVEFAPYFRQDAFMAIGAPTIYTLEDMLPVLAAMVEAVPYTDTGRRTHGFTFWSDWDDTLMSSAGNFAQMYGMRRFSQSGFIDYVNNSFISFLDDDGLYLRTLKLYFNANQMGLVDPDSPTQDFDAVWEKAGEGAFMFSWWSWLGMPAFNVGDRPEQGIGYNFIPIMDQTLVVPAVNPVGTGLAIGIGANAQDPARIIAFLDWMASPEGNMTVVNGPRGLTWDIVDGEPVITDFGLAAGVHTTVLRSEPVPEEWGGSTFDMGEWKGNMTVVLRYRGREIKPGYGFSYDPRFWPSLAAGGATPQLELNWQARFNALNQPEFLSNNNMLMINPVVEFVHPSDTSRIEHMRADVRMVIQPNSWRMVFASSEEEFYRIWEETKSDAYALGWAELLEFDRAVAEDYLALIRAAR